MYTDGRMKNDNSSRVKLWKMSVQAGNRIKYKKQYVAKWNISVAIGKKINRDIVSIGERKQKWEEVCLIVDRVWKNMESRLESLAEEGDSPVLYKQ